jgi:hypothetical protein
MESDYTLDDRVQSLAEAKDFFLASGSRKAEAHPASYPMGTDGLLSGVKRGRGVTLTTPI